MKYENLDALRLSEEQNKLSAFLDKNGLQFKDYNTGPQSMGEAQAKANEIIEEQLKTLGHPEQQSDEINQLLSFQQNAEDLKVVLEAKGFSEKPEEQQVTEFYTQKLEAIYQELEKQKAPDKVRSADIGKYLTENGLENLRKILIGSQKELSQRLWTKFKVKYEMEYDQRENKNIDDFFSKISDLPPEVQTDVTKLIEAFEKEFPQYKGKGQTPWYKDTFKAKLEALNDPDLKALNEFYKNDLKEIYKHVSNELGKAPEWEDIAAELKKRGKDEILSIVTRNRKANHKLWTETWKNAEKEFNKFENEELQKFTDSKNSAKDWADIDKLAEEFQKTHERFSGDKRLDWYKKELRQKLATKERFWKMEVNDFYATTLNQIYDKIPKSDKEYVRFKDVIAYLKSDNQEDLAYLLEEKFSKESTAAWDKFWGEKEKNHNDAEAQKFDAFFAEIDPVKFDNPEALNAEYTSVTQQKTNSEWFNKKLEAEQSKAQKKLENDHQELVNTLPDSALAKAMQSAFKSAETFADRVQWLKENKQKVAEYTPLIEQNKAQENELKTRAADHPDLKKELGEIKTQYNEGKKNYTEGFYSPRKYAAALSDLSTKLNERERLVDTTITTAENKTFNQIPKLTDKKKLTYDEFRDALKKLNFYGLDPAVRKNKKVRTALRTKTTALHQQWLDHRTLHIEQNQRTKIEKSQAVIRRVKLPKNLPAGLKSYEEFALALKEKGVYAALPKGVLKNDKVRATAHDQNLKMWTAYQASQAKVDAKNETPENAEISNNPKLEKAHNVIKGATLNTALKTKLDEKLKDKDGTNPDTFTVALREIGIYQGVDKSLWQTPALRELAWQQNIKLQKEYLSPDANKTVVENDQQAESNAEHGLPGHYKLDWKGLESRLAPDQKARGIERFKQMHNRSDIGLQTLMSQFHGPLGTFILETLAVMPRDRYDKAVNALRDVRVEAGKRDQASEWMKTLCQAAGTDYLQKEASASWSHFRQHFSTHFGQSIDKAWEEPELAEEIEAEVVTETSEELADNTAERASSILEAPIEEDDTPTPPASDDPIVADDAPELEPTIIEAAEIEEPLEAPVDDQLNLADELPANDTIDELLPEIDDTNLEAEEPVMDNTEEQIDEPVLAEVDFDDTESTDLPTIEGEEIFDENPETENTDLEADEVITDDVETDETPADDPEAETATDEDGESEPDLEKTTDDTPDDLENPDVTEETAETEADLSENLDTEDSPTLETVDDAEDMTKETEAVTEEPPEVIKIVLHTPEQQTARTQSATQAWKATQPPQDDTGVIAQLTPKWLKPKETNELPTEEELEAMLADPKLSAALKAKIEAQLTVKNKEPHFTTTLYQEVHFSSSMTVAKFLQQLKTYALLSANVELTIGQHNPSGEITKPQAQALFEAFAEKIHSTQSLKTLSVSMTKQALQVNSGAQVWQFEIE